MTTAATYTVPGTGLSPDKMLLARGFSYADAHRARLGVNTKGPTRLITDLCVFEPDPLTKEMTVVSIHPGVTREEIDRNTGWRVKYAADLTTTRAPSAEELATLRELHARTKRAHGDQG